MSWLCWSSRDGLSCSGKFQLLQCSIWRPLGVTQGYSQLRLGTSKKSIPRCEFTDLTTHFIDFLIRLFCQSTRIVTRGNVFVGGNEESTTNEVKSKEEFCPNVYLNKENPLTNASNVSVDENHISS